MLVSLKKKNLYTFSVLHYIGMEHKYVHKLEIKTVQSAGGCPFWKFIDGQVNLQMVRFTVTLEYRYIYHMRACTATQFSIHLPLRARFARQLTNNLNPGSGIQNN